MALTVTAINAAKARDKAYKLADSLGLYLLVAPSGGRLWRMNYRFLGRQKTLSFGNYPDVSLAKAREKRSEAREALADGRDPAEVRKEKVREQRAKAEETFRAIADEWFSRLALEGRAPKTLQKMRWLLARGTHWDERVKMMRHWSNYLDSLQIGGTILKANFRRK